MKTSLLLLLTPLLFIAHGAQTNTKQADMKWVDDEVAAIKPPRKGVTADALSGLHNPFADALLLNQPPQEEGAAPAMPVPTPADNTNFNLFAVMNAQKALIDGTWYQVDDKVHGYTVDKIGNDSVSLKKKRRKIELTLKAQNENIQINVK